MKFNTIIKNNKNKDTLTVALGYDEKNNIREIDLKENSSVIITGNTGTSKSILLNQILLQLINNNDENKIKIISLNPTKVELEAYNKSKYVFSKYIDIQSDTFEGIETVIKIRDNLFFANNVNTFNEYNKLFEALPYIVIAIDESAELLTTTEDAKALLNIIRCAKKYGLILLMDTNSVHNSFFENDDNTEADTRITFDFSDKEDAKVINLENANKLELKHFIMKEKANKQEEYIIFDYDDNIINKIL